MKVWRGGSILHVGNCLNAAGRARYTQWIETKGKTSGCSTVKNCVDVKLLRLEYIIYRRDSDVFQYAYHGLRTPELWQKDGILCSRLRLPMLRCMLRLRISFRVSPHHWCSPVEVDYARMVKIVETPSERMNKIRRRTTELSQSKISQS